jgi:hypothetical protein
MLSIAAMRCFLLTAVTTVLGACFGLAGTLPLTAKEISLMLRSGYSSEVILNDLATRHFAGQLDTKSESELAKANASPALLAALRTGNFAASKDELRQAQRKENLARVAAQKFQQQQQRATTAPQGRQIQSTPRVIIAHQSGATIQEREQERVGRFGVSELDVDNAALTQSFQHEFDTTIPVPTAAGALKHNLGDSSEATLKQSAVDNVASYGNIEVSGMQRDVYRQNVANRLAAEGKPNDPVSVDREIADQARRTQQAALDAAARQQAVRYEVAQQEADDARRKYDEVRFNAGGVDTFGLSTSANSRKAQEAEREYQLKVDEAEAAKRRADAAQYKADEARSPQ